eukprot:CAMPEP_0194039090 /NCGR_PEP_ID=MMETSP0009_2-20130614/11274_1 /TAXON_ID=210454 /ORGANISM="Grammatophora oceanica, Strain CCMP 410" /LENGTH=480 /DNA_ID=CAMNT_0038681821 /DNA_START=263 /DNA_END=1705 /DNA_ORIENTATION=+
MINIDWEKVQSLVLEQRRCAAAWQETKILHFIVSKDPPLDVVRVLVRELASDLNRWLMLDVGTGTPLGILCGMLSTNQQENQAPTVTSDHHLEFIKILLQGLLEWKNNEARPGAYCVPFASIDFSTLSLPILRILLDEYPEGLLQDDTFHRPPQGKGNAQCCFLGEVLLGNSSDTDRGTGNEDEGESVNNEDDYWSKVKLALRTVYDVDQECAPSGSTKQFLHLHTLLTALTTRATLVDSNLLEVVQKRLLPELRRRYPEEWTMPDAHGNFPLHILASAGSKLHSWLGVLLMNKSEKDDDQCTCTQLGVCSREGRLPLHVLLDNLSLPVPLSSPNARRVLDETDLALDMLRQMIVKSPRTLVVRDPVTMMYPFQLAVKESSLPLKSGQGVVIGGEFDRQCNDPLILSLNMSFRLLRQCPQVLSYFFVDKSHMEQPRYKELCLIDLKMAELERIYMAEKEKLQRQRKCLQEEEMNALLQVD